MQFTIYILAGGKSERMGQDKGLQKINRQEMVEYCIQALKPFQQEIVIITSNQEYQKFGFRLIEDEIKNEGPSQGIITALEDSQTDVNLVVSCDMPLIDEEILKSLVSMISTSEIICYQKDFVFPFPGIYSKCILPKWKETIADGNRRMQSLIKQFELKTLPITQPDLFLNVNTPQDLKKAVKALKQ